MLCASWNSRGKRPIFGIPVLLAALLDQPIGFLRGDDALRLVGGGAEHPHRVVMRQHHIFDRLVGDGADPLDHLVRHRRRRLRVEHEAAVVADDHRRVRIALGGEGVEVGADLGEGDFLLRHVGGGCETLGHQFNFLIFVIARSPCDEAIQFCARCLDCFVASAPRNDGLNIFILLLLLLLLAAIHQPPLGQFDRFAQHLDIADMVGKHQHQRGVEIGALRVA